MSLVRGRARARWWLRILLTMLFASWMTACAPRYIPPADPYERLNSDYWSASLVMEDAINEAADTKTFYTPTKETEAERSAAFKRLDALAKSGHIPSITVLSRLKIAMYEGTVGTLKNKKLRPRMIQAFKKSHTNERAALAQLKKLNDIGLADLHYCARTGYPDAATALSERELPLPAVDVKTRAQLNAEAQYAQALQNHRHRMADVGKALGAAVVLGAAAYAASKAPPNQSTTYNTLTPTQPNFSGCCSWHDGLERDILGNVVCHWTGAVLCKDGLPSPTCRCSN